MATTTPSPEPPLKRPRVSVPSVDIKREVRDGSACPYMDTITRSALDFDLPPICSVSLQSHNVYICLICGKYLQGRSPSSQAYAHSLQVRHHLYLGLSSEEVYCLPDGYQVVDPSFEEIVSALHPKFSHHDIANLDTIPVRIRLLDGSVRLRGAVPLDNLQAIDYANSIFQLFLRVSPIRDWLLQGYAAKDSVRSPYQPSGSGTSTQSQLVSALAKLSSKLWASHAYRPQVAPHELMQYVSRASKGRFGLLKQEDPVGFLAWLLNFFARTHASQTKSESQLSELVQKHMRGEMDVESYAETKLLKKSRTVFWFLPLDLPPKPLFKDSSERTLVPQVSLTRLLRKFDGISRQHDMKSGEQRSFRIRKFPPFLILVVRRFSKSKFGIDKNPCVVHLPAEGLDMSDIGEVEEGGKYSMIAAVLHEGTARNGNYRVVVRHNPTNSWYDLTDIEVKVALEELVSLAETYILMYARTDTK